MSVRAYRLIEIKTETEPAFNLWSDEGQRIIEAFALYEQLDGEGGGIIGVDIEELEALVDNPERGFNIEAETIKAIKRDIEATRANGDNYIEWYCY